MKANVSPSLISRTLALFHFLPVWSQVKPLEF